MSIWTNTTFQLLDPRMLLLDRNSRTILDIEAEDPELVASVKLHGVLVPLIANPAGDGQARVRDGHSRTLAAILAVDEHPVVPVLVTDCTDEQEWHRLRDQWIFNQVRRGYSAADEARTLEQMALFGLSEEEIAVQLSADPDTVAAALRVRASSTAAQALERHPQLSLVQVAAFAEFEDDPDACVQLEDTLAGEPDQFDHIASELRHARAALAAVAAKADELRATGLVVVTERPAEARELSQLRVSAADSTRLDSDLEAHTGCPGHAALVRRGYLGQEPRVEFVCENWREHGHVEAWSASSSRTRTGTRTEAEKADMRRVRTNNEKWRAAMDVRRCFLKELLGRKTPPKQAQRHLLLALVEGGSHLTRAMTQDNHRFACELLGLKAPQWGRTHPIAAKAKRASADQALMYSLATVLAAFELAYDLTTGVNTWRSPTAEDRLYFAALKDWGYTLSKVERLVLDPAADLADWPHLQAAPADPAHPAPDTDDDPGDLDTVTDGTPDNGVSEEFDDTDEAIDANGEFGEDADLPNEAMVAA